MSRRFALIANPGNRREALFSAAVAARGWPAPALISWAEVLTPGSGWERKLAGRDWLRIDSSGEDFAIERALIARGAAPAESENLVPRLTAAEAAALEDDPGRLRWQRQWYLGWREVLAGVGEKAKAAGIHCLSDPAEIAILFDKAATRERLATAEVPIAPGFVGPACWDELTATLAGLGWRRVFLKPSHGSSASGVVALESGPRARWRAWTHVAMLPDGPGWKLYNSLRLQRLEDPAQIARLTDALCGERLVVERWFPKASIAGRTFDLRILVIAGQPAHVVARGSLSPITNLHLGNRRADLGEVRRHMGEACWQAALETAARTAAAFPGCHQVAVDLMVSPDYLRCCVAEANAFGDLLPGVLWRGLETYEAELGLLAG